jgi:bisphosphoglycerate-dependent phosphoglycerate mutase
MDIRHDVALTMATSIAVVVVAIVTWAACHWWYGKKLFAAMQRLHKSDKGRQFSQEQTLQARRQVEQLKAELASHQRSASESQAAAARQRAAQREEELHASERTVPNAGFIPIVAAHGFADTQILPE